MYQLRNYAARIMYEQDGRDYSVVIQRLNRTAVLKRILRANNNLTRAEVQAKLSRMPDEGKRFPLWRRTGENPRQ